VLAYSTYRTVHRERRRIDAQRAVNLLLIAKASALTGALVAGGYVGFGLQFIDQLDVALPRERVIRSASAAVAGILIVVAGLLLERACRVPRIEDDDLFPGEHA
jgi:sulfite exporter TauE/SafE